MIGPTSPRLPRRSALPWQSRFGSSFKLSDKIPVVMSEPSVHVTGLEAVTGGPTTKPTVDRKGSASVVLKSPGRRSATSIKLVNEGTDQAPTGTWTCPTQ